MSDKPLFENFDEQEAEYAPEELPPGSPQARQARIEEGATGNVADEAVPVEGAVVPGASASTITGGDMSGSMGTTGIMGTPAVGPVVAGESVEGNTGVEDAQAEEDRSA